MVLIVLKLFEAFAGYGAGSFALRQLSIPFECVGFSEVDKSAILCFKQNHLGFNYGDITAIDWNQIPDFDLLTGGFPCQDVSVLGKQDLGKKRTTLGLYLTKALNAKMPKYFLFENVRGLNSKRFVDFKNLLIKSWRDAGYFVYDKVLNSKDFNSPQSRNRIWFVGIRNDSMLQPFEWPNPETLKIHLKDILELNVSSKYFLGTTQKNWLERKYDFLKKKQFAQIDGDIALCLRRGSFKSWHQDYVTTKNKCIRTLTPTEFFRLQGIYNINLNGVSLKSQYELAGNGWDINVASKVLRNILVAGGDLSANL